MRIPNINGGPLTDYEAIDVVCKAENAVVQGDVLQWSDTASAAYPLGIAVEDCQPEIGRVAGVMVAPASAAAGDFILVRVYGYCANITTDTNVAATDLYLRTGADGVCEGQTATEVNADITTADVNALNSVFAHNTVADAGAVGQGFIKAMGII